MKKILVYSAQEEALKQAFIKAKRTLGCDELEFLFMPEKLDKNTLIHAQGIDTICCFVNDELNAANLGDLHRIGVRNILIRAAGYNNVDMETAKKLGMNVMRVPSYSPGSIAEYGIALLLYFMHIKFSDKYLLHGKRIGIIGAGKIGTIVGKMLQGLGCQVFAYRPSAKPGTAQHGLSFDTLNNIYTESEVIFLTCPLNENTRYLVREETLLKMHKKPILVNIARGAVVKTQDVLAALETGCISGYVADVYEEEAGIFYYDCSDKDIVVEELKQLIRHPRTIITPHQAFFTESALSEITQIVLKNYLALMDNDSRFIDLLDQNTVGGSNQRNMQAVKQECNVSSQSGIKNLNFPFDKSTICQAEILLTLMLYFTKNLDDTFRRVKKHDFRLFNPGKLVSGNIVANSLFSEISLSTLFCLKQMFRMAFGARLQLPNTNKFKEAGNFHEIIAQTEGGYSISLANVD